MKPVVYIDGKEGTTGLEIYERLAGRNDIDLLLIDDEKRKDREERRKCINSADLVFLCLPDSAAIEAAGLVEKKGVKVIDASTAHRTDPGWAYGFPELGSDFEQRIRNGLRVANPGCHATGFISIVYPLTKMGLLERTAQLSAFSLTGYSGGGKKMIAEYSRSDRSPFLSSPALYGLGQNHKHLPEMQKICGLETKPIFTPIVDDYFKGMATTVPFRISDLKGVSSLEEIRDRLYSYYENSYVVSVSEKIADGKIYSNALADSDRLELILAGNDEQFTITALFDNLGKGASGAAVENMNIMLGFEATSGLNI